MSLSASVRLERQGFVLELALEVAAGETVALVGPNGSGKTTALRAVAGLEHPQVAHVEIGGAVVADTASGLDLPPERRSVAMVFGDYLLFNHLTVLENVAFGPRARGVPRRQARALAVQWLERLGIAELAGRSPSQLSGGQAQRVALARALVTEPAVLLLDEPLAALDAGSRADARALLRQHLAASASAAVLVTHDPVDAMVLADRLVVLEAGRVVQVGAPADVARRPASTFLARLVGVNLLRGYAAGGVVRLASGGEVRIADAALAGPAVVAVRPEVVAVHREQPVAASPRNVWRGTISAVESSGERVRLMVEGTPSLAVVVTPGAVAELGLHEGVPVWLTAKATEVQAYPA